jgi:hypothetical protein
MRIDLYATEDTKGHIAATGGDVVHLVVPDYLAFSLFWISCSGNEIDKTGLHAS